MKFENTQIGGIEPGPVTFRFPSGNDGLCHPYVNRSRMILGKLKQQMQMGNVGAGKVDLALDDGTLIHAQSNMLGLAHIDEIWITPVVAAIEEEVEENISHGGSFPIQAIITSYSTSTFYNNLNDLFLYVQDPNGMWIGQITTLNGNSIGILGNQAPYWYYTLDGVEIEGVFTFAVHYYFYHGDQPTPEPFNGTLTLIAGGFEKSIDFTLNAPITIEVVGEIPVIGTIEAVLNADGSWSFF